jgi:carbamoyltransferase
VIILGINAFHGDASAALLIDGELAAGVEEERFSRLKHQAGFPGRAANWVLESAGVQPHDIDHVAISRNPRANLQQKLLRVLRDRPSPRGVMDRISNQRLTLSVPAILAEALDAEPSAITAKFHNVEHHRAHLASAFFCSPFDDATAVSLDGMGDFTSGMWASGTGSHLDVHGRVSSPHSLGVFYTAFTQFLGMHNYGDEYKLMGLAAYGEPRLAPEVRKVVRATATGYRLDLSYFTHHRLTGGLRTAWADGSPIIDRLWSDRFIEAFGPAREPRAALTDRDRDLAASVQLVLEEVELELLRGLHARHPSPRLVMAGGVALNCTVNGMIRSETPFEELWIQPAANDSGTSLGAALWVQHQLLGRPRRWTMTHVAYGPMSDGAAIDAAIADAGLTSDRFRDDRELCDAVAARIADGAVVGWYQGRSELGPRALGQRSILCDPRRHDMKDLLNARIKHREPFRPFAPAVLAERTAEWFEQDYPSPFMLMTYRIRPEQQSRVPAVTHEDGTGRLQMVDADVHPRYHGLISAFERRTGVPILLNTSFNENEPIVNTAEEAIDCFLRTRMDVLVLDDRFVERSRVGQGVSEADERTTLTRQ